MTATAPNAKNLILKMLLAFDDEPLTARDLIVSCSIFDISENSVRVALVRLSSAGMVQAAGRGAYRLGPAARELADDVARWRSLEQRVRPWNGQYVVVHANTLGRSDRAALRQRERALDMLGLRELERGLFVRPDNIEDSVDAVRHRLYSLGLERGAGVFLGAGFDPEREAHARQLWDGKALNARYRKWRTQLEEWLARADDLEPDVAARESFLLGGGAIRQIVFDPWLPEPLVDVQERHAFVETVRRYDATGRAVWKRFYEFSTGQTVSSRALTDNHAH